MHFSKHYNDLIMFIGGYRYSIKNCLYEGVLQKIISECSCLPSFVELNNHNLSICIGEKLGCAFRWMDYLGSSKDPDLTNAKSAHNKTQKCLQRCNLQTETMMTTTSKFPNRETFPYRKEMCYVLQKISKICNNSIQRVVFEPNLQSGLTCSDILEMNNTLKVCSNNDIADITTMSTKPHLIDFLFDYADKNLAVLYIYIKDPYYTSMRKDENIAVISFIGNAGGLLGLCMGLSFVSVFEIVYHLARYWILKLASFCNCLLSNKTEPIQSSINK